METVGTTAQGLEKPLELTWRAFWEACDALAERWAEQPVAGVYGIPTGGSFVAVEVARILQIPLLDAPSAGCVVVDDLVATGKTLEKYARFQTDVLFRKAVWKGGQYGQVPLVDCWIKFPWEHEAAPTDAVTRLLEFMGEDPGREGLKDTPGRYVRALKELTGGYAEDPKKILEGAVFEEDYDQMVIVKDLEFYSLCEHHLMPFHGRASIGYLPKKKVLGLSKMARLLHCFSRRLQIQERLTTQIAKALKETLEPLGVGVVLEATHTCMGMRGVRTSGDTLTSCFMGALRSDVAARGEFLTLSGYGGRLR